MDGFSPNLHGCTTKSNLRAENLVTITSFSGGLTYVKISLKLIYLLYCLLDCHQSGTDISLGYSKEFSVIC